MPSRPAGEPPPPTFVQTADELRSQLGRLDAGELVLLAQLYLRAGRWEQGLALCETADGAQDGPALRLCEASALFALGQHAAAMQRLEAVLAAEPAHLLARSYKAQMLRRGGDVRGAEALLREIVDRCPDFPGALSGLASLVFPGPDYRRVLERVHQLLKPRVYLEIGVDSGSTLSLAAGSARAIGIDPAERPLRYPVPKGAVVYREPSDAFFETRRRESVLGDERVDLAFVDGLHWFEFALRDFVNVERWCRPESTIVLHDCLPVAAVTSTRRRRSDFWVGDTWKALECLLRYRPDLSIVTVPCFPSGLVLVRGLDPGSTTLSDAMDEIAAEYGPRTYPHMPGRWPAALRVVENTEAGLARALGLAAP